jgi:hypothetical protein
MLAVCVIALTAWAVLISLGSPWLALIAAVMLVVAITPFLLPTRYRLDDAGIAERRLWITRSRRWSELHRLDVGRASALVSPYAKARWLDRYRGITVSFDGAERERVIRALQAAIGGPRDGASESGNR